MDRHRRRIPTRVSADGNEKVGCSAGARARQIGLLYAQFSFYRPLAPRSTVHARQTALVPQRPAWRRQTLDETPVLVCPLTCSHYVTLPRASPSCPRLGLGPGTWERREAIERPSAALCTELRGCTQVMRIRDTWYVRTASCHARGACTASWCGGNQPDNVRRG